MKPIPSDPKIIVSKSHRRLALYSGDERVRVYRIGLGFNPVDDKVREGDGCTPEGIFYICVKNPKSRYDLSLCLSYPNEEDARRGLRDGLLTQAEYDQILNAVREKRMPPQKTALGGEIYIHGGGANGDWTRGCLSLDDGDMKELYEAVPLGTRVMIKSL